MWEFFFTMSFSFNSWPFYFALISFKKSEYQFMWPNKWSKAKLACRWLTILLGPFAAPRRHFSATIVPKMGQEYHIFQINIIPNKKYISIIWLTAFFLFKNVFLSLNTGKSLIFPLFLCDFEGLGGPPESLPYTPIFLWFYVFFLKEYLQWDDVILWSDRVSRFYTPYLGA